MANMITAKDSKCAWSVMTLLIIVTRDIIKPITLEVSYDFPFFVTNEYISIRLSYTVIKAGLEWIQ